MIVSRAEFPPWAHDHEPSVRLPTTTDEVDVLDLVGDGWHIEVCETRRRPATGTDGPPAPLLDDVVLVRRVDRAAVDRTSG